VGGYFFDLVFYLVLEGAGRQFEPRGRDASNAIEDLICLVRDASNANVTRLVQCKRCRVLSFVTTHDGVQITSPSGLLLSCQNSTQPYLTRPYKWRFYYNSNPRGRDAPTDEYLLYSPVDGA
jgi:hypothetical protein